MFDIQKLKAGDEGEWAKLQDRYFRRIFFYVKRHVGDYQKSEDLTQDVFLGAIRGISRFDEAFNVEQFLFGIARNKLIDHFRKVGRSGATVGLGSSGDDSSNVLEAVAGSDPTPSSVLVDVEKLGRQRNVLVNALRELVAKFWKKGDFDKLKTIELVFCRNMKYTDIVQKVAVRDERAVASIKFQAVQELQRLARARDPRKSLFSGLWKK
jgi:RNA polymerase sigma-70 factor (ECF subfamily)